MALPKINLFDLIKFTDKENEYEMTTYLMKEGLLGDFSGLQGVIREMWDEMRSWLRGFERIF